VGDMRMEPQKSLDLVQALARGVREVAEEPAAGVT
jgi:hypothetical protein